MRKSFRKDILNWFEEEGIHVLFIDKTEEGYKVKVYEESLFDERVEKLKKEFNVVKIKNSSYTDMFSKWTERTKSIFIKENK